MMMQWLHTSLTLSPWEREKEREGERDREPEIDGRQKLKDKEQRLNTLYTSVSTWNGTKPKR